MSTRNPKRTSLCGHRLAKLRKRARLTQQELATRAGISRRMIAYYEREAKRPPAAVLPELSKALGVTVDELLGLTYETRTANVQSKLVRLARQIERLSMQDQTELLRIIDRFLREKRDRL